VQEDPPIRRRQAGDEREELLQPSLYSQRSVRMESKAMVYGVVGRGGRPSAVLGAGRRAKRRRERGEGRGRGAETSNI
jgi:hypothetical protein